MDRICKILVVEDDDAVRALLGDVLDYAGYEFTLASNGAETRRALDADDYDVAIIDIGLRDGDDGFTLAELADAKGCGIILTTGDLERRSRLEASGRHHMMKPFRMQELTRLVDRILKDNEALCTPRRRDSSPLTARA